MRNYKKQKSLMLRNLQVRVVEFTHYFVVDYQKGAYSDRHLFDLKNKFVDNGS